LVSLTDAAFHDGTFMYLSVMATDFFVEIHRSVTNSISVSTYAPCVYMVCFRQAMLYTGGLGCCGQAFL
jgi:hypothetical protein